MLFFGCMFVVMSLIGYQAFDANATSGVSTKLSAAVTSGANTLSVRSTQGFPPVGVLMLEDEQVRYTDTTANTFVGLPAQAMTRGFDDTDAVSHAKGVTVRTVELGLINNAFEAKLANITDSAGIMKFFAVGDAAISLLTSFFTVSVPGEIAIVTTLWFLSGVLFLVYLALTFAGGRRV
jgi:hypothetical protein